MDTRFSFLTGVLMLLLSGIWVGCQRTEEPVFPRTVHLTAEKIPLNQIAYPEVITLADGYFVFTCSQTDSLIYFYTVPDLQFVGKGGRKGEGPGEFLSFANFCGNREGRLILLGFPSRNFRQAHLDSTGRMVWGDWYKFDSFDALNWPRIIGDSLLVYSTLFNIKKYDLKNGKPLGEVFMLEPGEKRSTMTPNMGYIAANDTSVVYAYPYKNRFDLFDISTLKLKKSVIGPGKTQIEQGSSGTTTRYYIYPFATESRFYLLKAAKDRKPDEYKVTMQVFDNDANPVVEYTFDIGPGAFVVDEDNGYIYSFNELYEDFLLRYKLL